MQGLRFSWCEQHPHRTAAPRCSRSPCDLQDIWIQNAGLSQRVKSTVATTSQAELASIVDTNLTGALLGARAAISRMMTQPAGGKLFLVDGNGRWVGAVGSAAAAVAVAG